MKTSILKTAAIALLSLSIVSCSHSKIIAPIDTPIDPPIEDSINVTYVIEIKSVDTTRTTNLVDGLGYTYKDTSGSWRRVVKYAYDGSFKPVHAGDVIKGSFKVPTGLDNINFQSQLFLLTSTTGDPAMNSNNIATLRVFEDGILIVDKSPTGTPANSFYWGVGGNKWDIGVLTPLHR